jgi:hypothetical protein
MLLQGWTAFHPDPEGAAVRSWIDRGVPEHLARSLVSVSAEHLVDHDRPSESRGMGDPEPSAARDSEFPSPQPIGVTP